MTLLEALLATVILSVVAVACLEGTRGAASLQRVAASTTVGVARAEAAMAQAATGAPLAASDIAVTRVPYRAAGARGPSHLERVDVTVPVTGGGAVHLTRLVRRAGEAR
jgi:type II secretory pathway pseudopilin PulG